MSFKNIQYSGQREASVGFAEGKLFGIRGRDYHDSLEGKL
jgi:hypothetical protein